MTRVVIDTDPGTDDALALIMALNSPDLDVMGLTTVGGNARLAHTTRNALRLLEYLDQADIPVCRGASRPLRGRFRYAYDYHGPAGLTVRLPSPESTPEPMRAANYIMTAAAAFQGELVLIALGPLTNVATALTSEPRLAGWLKRIVVMGGAVEVAGNVTPHAEFNISNDPAAANIVFSSGAPVTLVGLDVCNRVSFIRGEVRRNRSASKSARLAGRILGNWFASHGEASSYMLCDPLAVVAAIAPRTLTHRQAKVTVETVDPERIGQTTAVYGTSTVSVTTGVNADESLELIRSLLSGPETL